MHYLATALQIHVHRKNEELLVMHPWYPLRPYRYKSFVPSKSDDRGLLNVISNKHSLTQVFRNSEYMIQIINGNVKGSAWYTGHEWSSFHEI